MTAQTPPARRPRLSVIVTTYTMDRLGDVQELLDSLRAQSFPDMEIIFVGERTPELCARLEEYGKKNGLPGLKLLFNDGSPGLSSARNLGAQRAESDILAFIDDDAVALPGWAEAIVTSHEDAAVIAVTGPALPLWEDPSLQWLPEEFYWFVSCTAFTGWDSSRDVRNAWGMNMSFRRDVFGLCGGFRADFGIHGSARTTWHDPPSEDVDLSIRARKLTGKRILFNPAARIRHRVTRQRLAWSSVAQRSFSVGYQRRMIQKLYRDDLAGGGRLTPERDLAGRIATRLLPRVLRSAFAHPVTAAKQLSLIVVSLFFVALGYARAVFTRVDAAGREGALTCSDDPAARSQSQVD